MEFFGQERNRWPAWGGALLCVALLLGWATGTNAATQGAYGKAGRWITDDQGRVVNLHGWNIVNKFEPYTLEAIGFDQDDVEFLRDEGFAISRAPASSYG